MGEFQEKVEDFKESLKQPGFTVPDDLEDVTPAEDNVAQQDVIEAEGETPEQEKKSERRSHVRRERLKHKVDQLRYENRLKDEQNQRLLMELQEKERLLADKQYQMEEAVNNDHSRYLESLLLREQAVLNELKIAKEEGDTQKEVDLTRDLSQITADKSTYGLYKSQIHNQHRQRAPYDHQDDYPQSFSAAPVNQSSYQDNGEPEHENYKDWLYTNPWADPQSREYSPRLRSKVEHLSNNLNDLLMKEGRGDLIGTPEYYDSLDKLMIDGPSANNEAPPPQDYEYSGSSMVAPVSRSGSSMSDHYMSSNPNRTRGGMALTKDEFTVARNLIQIPGRAQSVSSAITKYREGKEYKGGIDAEHPYRYRVPE